MSALKRVGENIRSLRRVREMTLEALALAADTDTGNLSRLERGEQGYSHDLLERISGALQCDISELFAPLVGAPIADLPRCDHGITDVAAAADALHKIRRFRLSILSASGYSKYEWTVLGDSGPVENGDDLVQAINGFCEKRAAHKHS